jgi:hypothetical protein
VPREPDDLVRRARLLITAAHEHLLLLLGTALLQAHITPASVPRCCLSLPRQTVHQHTMYTIIGCTPTVHQRTLVSYAAVRATLVTTQCVLLTDTVFPSQPHWAALLPFPRAAHAGSRHAGTYESGPPRTAAQHAAYNMCRAVPGWGLVDW